MAFPTGYTKYQEVTIDYTKVDATLTDYPCLIDLSDLDKTTDIFDTCRSDGGDIRVTLTNGTTQLAREVVSIDTSGKTGELHVKIPSLSSSVDTVIRIWYNGIDTEPAEDATYGKENTWNSDYKMVQHMNQDPSGSSPQMIDSTSNDNDGTSAGSMTSGDLVDAQIGKGLDFDGIDDLINFGNDASLDVSTLTLSCWFSPATTISSGVTHGIISKDYTSSAAADKEYVLSFNSGDSGRLRCGTWGGNIQTAKSSWLSSAQYKIDFVYVSSTEGYVYVNGSEDNYDSDYAPGAIDGTGTNPLVVGSSRSGTSTYDWLTGSLDEVRVLSDDLSDDWISTEYNNQSSPSTFYSVSDEQDVTTTPPTTLAPTTLSPTSLAPTTIVTTLAPTTDVTTIAPTTLEPTTIAPTTLESTTLAPTTLSPTTLEPTTIAPTTLPPTTLEPTTLAPTTLPPTSLAPTTDITTLAPTTDITTTAPTTLAPTTIAPTSLAPTTEVTTLPPTTLTPTTTLTTPAPTTAPPSISACGDKAIKIIQDNDVIDIVQDNLIIEITQC